MQSLCRIAALTTAMALAPAAIGQPVYKWVDDNGVTHYAQQPPAHGEAQLIDPADSPRPPAEPQSDDDTAAADDASTDAASDDSDDSELPSNMSEYCQQMRERAETLAGDAPLQIRQDDGNLQKLSDEQRAERLEQTRSQIDQHCGDESA